MKAIEAIDDEYKEEAAKRRKELEGRPSKNLASKEAQILRRRSAEDTAKALGVSKSTVERVRAIEHEETPQEINPQGICQDLPDVYAIDGPHGPL